MKDYRPSTRSRAAAACFLALLCTALTTFLPFSFNFTSGKGLLAYTPTTMRRPVRGSCIVATLTFQPRVLPGHEDKFQEVKPCQILSELSPNMFASRVRLAGYIASSVL